MKNLFILLIVSISMICAQDIPDWITNIPSDDDYYWALEEIMTLNMNESEYKTKANEQALLTISMQIKATVSGTVEMSATETTESLDESFTMKTFSSTMADIEGAEKVSEFQMAAKYWVLWRLKKSTHQESMARHVESAIGFYEGFTYVSDTDPVTQLQYLISAYENIVKVVGMDVIFEEKTDLRVEIPNKIRSINNALRLVSDGPNSFTGKVGFALSKPLKVKVIVGEEVVPTGLPIRFSFSDGEGSFENELVTMSSTGKSETKISKIISRKRVQRVRAQVDLNELRENRMSRFPAFEAHLNGISQTNSISFTIDVAEVTQEKIAVITVGDTSAYNEYDLKRLNRAFRSEFIDITEFKLKDEQQIENIIESYKRSATLCSNEECQIQIGKKLAVEKLIFIDVADYPKQTSITIFLRNIAENELEQEFTYTFDKKSGDSKEEKIKRILENGPYMVKDFWYRNNPGYLTLNCLLRGVKAEFEYLDHSRWMDKTFEKRVPLNSEQFFEGDYEININKMGYEKYHSRFEVIMGDFPEFNINLKAKRPGRAFFRSLIVPGRGQLYASDQDHRGRYWMGITYFVSTMACVGSTGYMWNEYFSAKDEYNTSKNEYNVAVLLEDIQLTQDIMTVNHTSMTNKQNQAILLTGITSGLWLFNALDAFLFFPKEYKTKRLSLNIDNTILAGNPSALVELKLSF
ncbi:MAG: hypothetical protein HOO10_02710 [Candidatus Marinimicrobia bacterium]|jgi:hypothetical protein|nr:hypothetical protein [Candidatus Neomarinimicrobiota bacterium]